MKTYALLLMILGWLPLMAATAATTETNQTALLELHIRNIGFDRNTQSPVVILVDKDSKKFLPIWIGFSEAQAIAMEMEKIKPPRPMTHDLLQTLVKELDGKIEHVIITEIKANTFIASLTLQTHGKTKTIDCRPSDAIAIALRVPAPILASASVMKAALPFPDEAGGKEIVTQELPAIGLRVQELTPDLAVAFALGKAKGVLVSASAQKEILRGDLIQAVGDTKVESLAELTAALDNAGKAKEIVLKILHDGKIATVRVRPVKN